MSLEESNGARLRALEFPGPGASEKTPRRSRRAQPLRRSLFPDAF